MKLERFEEIMNSDIDYNFYNLSDGLFKGLELIRKYIPDATIETAEHDQIYSESISDICNTKISEEDICILKNYGWFASNDYLSHFV